VVAYDGAQTYGDPVSGAQRKDKKMGNRDEKLIDSMVHRTLVEMLDWSEVERTPENVYQFAANKLDFPVTRDEVEEALPRKMRCL
jgi:hypothetical protein